MFELLVELLIEHGKFDQVGVRDAFYWLAGFAPGSEAAFYHVNFES
jgi:hypothetical protein